MSSKPNRWLTAGSVWFQSVSTVLNNDNRPEPAVDRRLGFEAAPYYNCTLHLIWVLFRGKMIKVAFKGVLHPWALFLKTLCIFSKKKATSDKVSYGSGQKCSKELKNHSFTSVETIVVKLQ